MYITQVAWKSGIEFFHTPQVTLGLRTPLSTTITSPESNTTLELNRITVYVHPPQRGNREGASFSFFTSKEPDWSINGYTKIY